MLNLFLSVGGKALLRSFKISSDWEVTRHKLSHKKSDVSLWIANEFYGFGLL